MKKRWLFCVLISVVWPASACAASDNSAFQAKIAEVMQAFQAPLGPALDVDTAKLSAALECHEAAGSPKAESVLLIHGTGLTPRESWRRTYMPALTDDGYTTCTLTLPDRALDDVQVSSEYAVYAVRRLYERSGNKVNVITHSQGALEARWAIKFWPDIRDEVDDVIMLSGSNHGTLLANLVCLQKLLGCTPSVAQQRSYSRFLAALNNGDETPGNVNYTSVFSYTDEVVITRYGDPSPALEGATNIAVQKLCKFRPVTHVAMITSSPVYAIVRDALDHEGPAKLARIDRKRACRRIVAGDMQPISGVTNILTLVPAVSAIFLNPGVQEPALKDYAQSALPQEDQSPSFRRSRELLASSSLR